MPEIKILGSYKDIQGFQHDVYEDGHVRRHGHDPSNHRFVDGVYFLRVRDGLLLEYAWNTKYGDWHTLRGGGDPNYYNAIKSIYIDKVFEEAFLKE